MSASRALIAVDLLQFGERAVAAWVSTCMLEEKVRVSDVADFLIYWGPTSPSGNSMMYSTAFALAAVYIHDGTPRTLARSRRDRTVVMPEVPKDEDGRAESLLEQSRPDWFAVGEDLIEFWATDPHDAVEARHDRARMFEERSARQEEEPALEGRSVTSSTC